MSDTIERSLRSGFRAGLSSGADVARRLAAHEAELDQIERETEALRRRLHLLAAQLGASAAERDGWHH